MVIKLTSKIHSAIEGKVIAHQVIRSATSVGANYRAACRARSRAEFASKLGIVEEEADESAFWLELIQELKLLPNALLDPALQEARELTRIMAASRKTSLFVESKPKNHK